ncbi:MAG: hypothetical protein ABIF92_02540 [archaeon]
MKILTSEQKPVSTREIGLKIGVSWHTVDRHCLRLQLREKITGYRLSNLNVWEVKR